MNGKDSVERANCYVALELSRSKWLVGRFFLDATR